MPNVVGNAPATQRDQVEVAVVGAVRAFAVRQSELDVNIQRDASRQDEASDDRCGSIECDLDAFVTGCVGDGLALDAVAAQEGADFVAAISILTKLHRCSRSCLPGYFQKTVHRFSNFERLWLIRGGTNRHFRDTGRAISGNQTSGVSIKSDRENLSHPGDLSITI